MRGGCWVCASAFGHVLCVRSSIGTVHIHTQYRNVQSTLVIERAHEDAGVSKPMFVQSLRIISASLWSMRRPALAFCCKPL